MDVCVTYGHDSVHDDIMNYDMDISRILYFFILREHIINITDAQ